MTSGMTRIVILGGGFGGVYTARHLERSLTRAEHGRVEITLVSKENYVVFQPLSPEVISGSVDMLHVISPIRRFAKRTRLVTREVEAIDLDRKVVTARTRASTALARAALRSSGHRHGKSPPTDRRFRASPSMPFRSSISAMRCVCGITSSAVSKRGRHRERPRSERRRLLTFVVAGGGFSGVECIAELQDFLRDAVPRLSVDRPRMGSGSILLQRDARILPELTEIAARMLAEGAGEARHRHPLERRLAVDVGAQRDARAQDDQGDGNDRGGDVRRDGSGRTAPGRRHAARRRAWPHSGATSTWNPQRNGVWALGDCALVSLADGTTSPPTAQHALRQAKTCAANILAALRGGTPSAFTFSGLGKLASLGRRNAVAEILGVRITGLPAWLALARRVRVEVSGFDGQARLLVDSDARRFPASQHHAALDCARRGGRTRAFSAGESVFAAGDVGDKGLFLWCAAHWTPSAMGTTVGALGAGDVFGETALSRDVDPKRDGSRHRRDRRHQRLPRRVRGDPPPRPRRRAGHGADRGRSRPAVPSRELIARNAHRDRLRRVGRVVPSS